jgi:PAS domain S-box-containing protein
MGAFILLAVLATAVASAVAVWLFLLTGWASDFWFVWRQRILANVFAIVAIPPVIVLAFVGQLLGAHATRRSYLELALITVGVLVVGIPVFGLESPGPSNLPYLMLAPLPFLMWAAVRVGVGGTALTLLIVAGIAVVDAFVGRGPFINRAPEVNVFSLQIFLAAISIPTLLLAAVVEERRQEAESLKQTSKEAELALAERSLQLELAEKSGLVGTYAYDIGDNDEKATISAGYAAILGLPEGTAEITRSVWLASVHPEDAKRLQVRRSQAFQNRQREYQVDYRVIRAGEFRWIESRRFVSYNSDGCAQRVIGVDIDITERKRAEERQRVLVAELDHRVKNALATVSSIVAQTAVGSKSIADFVAALDGRIRSMAKTQELLSSGAWQGISLTELIRNELAPYAASDNTKISGPEVILRPETGRAMAMVLHELTTNAAKYGALSTSTGQVSIQWRLRINGQPPSYLVLDWQETGGPRIVAPGKSSYGTSTICDLIPFEFGGTVDLTHSPEGVRCRVALPGDWLSPRGDEAISPARR